VISLDATRQSSTTLLVFKGVFGMMLQDLSMQSFLTF